MTSFERMICFVHRLCFAHGYHLSLIDFLYARQNLAAHQPHESMDIDR